MLRIKHHLKNSWDNSNSYNNSNNSIIIKNQLPLKKQRKAQEANMMLGPRITSILSPRPMKEPKNIKLKRNSLMLPRSNHKKFKEMIKYIQFKIINNNNSHRDRHRRWDLRSNTLCPMRATSKQKMRRITLWWLKTHLIFRNPFKKIWAKRIRKCMEHLQGVLRDIVKLMCSVRVDALWSGSARTNKQASWLQSSNSQNAKAMKPI